MEKLLSEWGFSHLLSEFEDQEIDEEALLCLNMENLKEIIPKIGPRMKFFSKLKQYQNIMNMSVVLESHEEKNEMPGPLLFSSPCMDANLTDVTLSDFTVSSPSTSSASSTAEASAECAYELTTAFQNASKRPLPFYGQAMFKKACRNAYNLNLQEFLNKTVTGKFIINTYNTEKRFSRKMRSQLSYILVSGLMSDYSENLIPLDFEILCEKICDLFPTETKCTYYIPRIPGTKTSKPVNARGKLIDKYRNLKRLYNLPKTENDETLARQNNATNTNSISDIDELNNCAKWLRTYQEPWNLVIQNWEKTFPLRQIVNSSPTVEEYMHQWPILKHKDAYSLIEFDFQQLHPNCAITSLLSEYQKWERFFDSLKNISIFDKTTEEFIGTLSADISQDSKNAIQIAALPMLFPPKCRIRCKKTHWKPSIIECQESLINIVSTCADIEAVILKRRRKLSDLNITVQPYLVVVGASFSLITECYLVVDNNIYKTCSVLQGIDFAFKAFHGLNASYPKESEHIWLLIERSLYKIESSDIKIPAVLTVLKDLENI